MQNDKRIRLILLSGGLAFGIFLLFASIFNTVLWKWEQKTVDCRFRIRGPIATTPAVVHIDIDDKSIAAFGPWPWNRSIHACLIERLDYLSVASLVFDIIWGGERSRDEDAALVAAARKAKTAILPVGFELQPFSATTSPSCSIRTGAGGGWTVGHPASVLGFCGEKCWMSV